MCRSCIIQVVALLLILNQSSCAEMSQYDEFEEEDTSPESSSVPSSSAASTTQNLTSEVGDQNISISIKTARGGETTASDATATSPNATENVHVHVQHIPSLPRICSLQVDNGYCAPGQSVKQESRYYYDTHSRTCKTFKYIGCGGNRNNFNSTDACYQRCNNTEIYDSEEDNRLADVCKENMTVGQCPENSSSCNPTLRYFYNYYEGKCELFTYKGSGGNNNRFDTLEKCQTECTYAPFGECTLDPDKGTCNNSFTRYYWNKHKADCEAFVYSGCEGNENNFGTAEECQKHCRRKTENLERWTQLLDAARAWVKRGMNLPWK